MTLYIFILTSDALWGLPIKVLIASRSVSHFPYFNSIVYELEKRGHEITILYDYYWSKGENLSNGYRGFGGQVQWSHRRSDKYRNSIFTIREIRTYLNYARQTDQSPYYRKRWAEYIPRWSRLFPVNFLPLCEWYEKRVPADKKIMAHIRAIDPAVVMACPANHRFSEEIDYIKAAKSLGIPTVITNYSWDNMTTKGFYHVKPDIFCVWNESQKKDAIGIHGISKDSIRITGAPFFDKWITPPLDNTTRKSFCKSAGIDHKKSYVLYLGSSSKIAKDETWLINKIGEDLKMQVLVRPHPANYKRYIYNKELNVLKPELIDTAKSARKFMVALKHSTMAFGINNSAMLDAIINDKLCTTHLAGEYLDTQYRTKHFQDMLPSLYVLNSNSGRKLSNTEFVDKYIRPLNISAGEATADVLEGMCAR